MKINLISRKGSCDPPRHSRQARKIRLILTVLFGAVAQLSLAQPIFEVATDSPLQSAFLKRDGSCSSTGDLHGHFTRVLKRLESGREASLAVALERLEASRKKAWSIQERASHEKALRDQRNRNVQVLKEYRDRGLFPKNDYLLNAIPIFVDRRDTACAVGYLMRRSGAGKAVEEIARTDRLLFVDEVNEGPLVDWVLSSGLTQEEASVIQPG